jgi:hypothetical protein
MADLAGRKVFKVFNQEFVVDERYNVTKELGQGAYGIVWYVYRPSMVERLNGTLTMHPALLRTTRLVRAWLSRKSPMCSARRFWPNAR